MDKEQYIASVRNIEEEESIEYALPQKMKIILEYDTALQKQAQKIPHIDHIEFLNKLCRYSLTWEEINQTMKYYFKDKWVNASQGIKEDLYKIGIESSETKTKNTLGEYLDLNIQKIRIYPNKADSMIKITLNEGVVELSKDALLSSKEFRSYYYILSKGVLLRNLKSDIWSKLLTFWTKKHGIIIETDQMTEDLLVREKIIDELQNFTVVRDLKQCTSYGRVYLNGDDNVMVPGYAIESIIKKNKWQHKITRVAYWLEDYLAAPSVPKRIGNTLTRFWQFKKDKLDMDYENVFEEESEEE